MNPLTERRLRDARDVRDVRDDKAEREAPDTQVGPVEAANWPDQLDAFVVEAGPRPRLLGYDVYADLARHYSLASVFLTALAGATPSLKQARAFETLLVYLSPISVAEAPAHAARLAQVVGAGPDAVVATAVTGLTQQALQVFSSRQPLWHWLQNDCCGDPPALTIAVEDGVEDFRQAMRGIDFDVPLLCTSCDLDSALLAASYACGIRTSAAWVATYTLARLGCAIAEATAVPPGSFAQYPTRLPKFEYTRNHKDDR